MKILLCGKGGSGKSTVAALLAKNLQLEGYRVLVVDVDESNYGLSSQLGLADPRELIEQIGGKSEVKSKMGVVRSDGHKAPVFSETWNIDNIPSECLSKKDNLYLLQIGKVKHYGEGCACPMGVLSKDFVTNLSLEPMDIAVIDTEAGVEHLGRSVAAGVDLILGIIDPSYESIRLSEKMSAMAKESKKPIQFIINKAEDAFADRIISRIGKERVIGIIPFSKSVQEKGFAGEALDANSLNIADITRFILCIQNRRVSPIDRMGDLKWSR
ncbi:MAG: P-loop NTPase [Nitrososphaerota archaeon]|uniref:ATP-binding protein n=1 Tax=Candidatus Bathycorpusculum sp. TaxID=2994959 RepID=UPI00282C28CD|nr:P-loop NTPase [Candidatus Termiticorpusculum sp.]MCL2257629.1 P-loop NTPase [Candidatus Termiticorpusculum sp.]MCL2292238.1 P-loop NTPase [Candidatus Termiticorpusculum sp.]MDR0460329.1 P-loop NTPase [Nitrososphaerota archaeon]